MAKFKVAGYSILAFVMSTGQALTLQPGVYELDENDSAVMDLVAKKKLTPIAAPKVENKPVAGFLFGETEKVEPAKVAAVESVPEVAAPKKDKKKKSGPVEVPVMPAVPVAPKPESVEEEGEGGWDESGLAE